MKTITLILVHVLVVASQNQEDCERQPDQKFEDGKCVQCPVCRPGYGLKGQCGFGQGAGLECEPCPVGMYNKDHDGNRCIQCTRCEKDYNRHVKYKCRSTIDAECEGCLPNYFDSYRDAIDGQLYECTICSMRPDDPQCKESTSPSSGTVPAVQTMTPIGTPHKPDKDEPTSKGSSPNLQARSSATAQLSSSNSEGTQGAYVGSQASTTNNKNNDTTKAIIKAVIGTALTLISIMLIVILIWKRKYVVQVCRRKKRTETNNNPEEPPAFPGPESARPIQMLPLLASQRNEAEVPNTNTRPRYSRTGSDRSGEEEPFRSISESMPPLSVLSNEEAIALTPEPTPPDSAYDSPGEKMVVILPAEESDGMKNGESYITGSNRGSPTSEMRSDYRRSEYAPLTLETKGDSSSQNSSSASIDHSPNGSVSGAPCTLITNTSSKPSTIVFNGPTTVRIGPHQLGFRQDINNINPNQETISVTNSGHSQEQYGNNSNGLPVPEQNGRNRGYPIPIQNSVTPQSSHGNLIVPTQAEEHSTEAKIIG